MKSPIPSNLSKTLSAKHAFRAAVFRGLGVLLPPLLTVLILIWVVNTVKIYVLQPVSQATRDGLVWLVADVRDQLPEAAPGEKTVHGDYHQLAGGSYVPEYVFQRVAKADNSTKAAAYTGEEIYRRYVELEYLKPFFAIPLFLAIFILLLYLLGKFIAIGVGGYFANAIESGIRRLPVVRNVYSASKQISDFLFSQREFEFTRIVAVEPQPVGYRVDPLFAAAHHGLHDHRS